MELRQGMRPKSSHKPEGPIDLDRRMQKQSMEKANANGILSLPTGPPCAFDDGTHTTCVNPLGLGKGIMSINIPFSFVQYNTDARGLLPGAQYALTMLCFLQGGPTQHKVVKLSTAGVCTTHGLLLG
jgi:hypothetical protein